MSYQESFKSVIVGHKTAATSLKLVVWCLRLCSILSLVILYYFWMIQWVYVSAASTDGRLYSIQVMQSE